MASKTRGNTARGKPTGVTKNQRAGKATAQSKSKRKPAAKSAVGILPNDDQLDNAKVSFLAARALFLGQLPTEVVNALAYEQETWAIGATESQAFYTAKPGSAKEAPGTLLTLEAATDTNLYTLPPMIAMSRFTYQSETIDGRNVPVSACILWPVSPRKTLDGGYQVVAWAHGTTGVTGNTVPSHFKNLSYQFLALYALVMNGYVVVATDYAGLGIRFDSEGNEIVHPWLVSSAQANDVFYAVQAARQAFPELSKKFVVIGHSQGGGVAWGCAERQAKTPVAGYLGAVAVAPFTSLASLESSDEMLVLALFPVLKAYIPDFDPALVFTPEGIQIAEMLNLIGADFRTLLAWLSEEGLQLLPGALQGPVFQEFDELAGVGGRQIAEPLLVLQGTTDVLIDPQSTVAAAEATALADRDARIELVLSPGADHDPSLVSTQPKYMDWIAARFAGLKAPEWNGVETLSPARPVANYQAEQNYFLKSQIASFQT